MNILYCVAGEGSGHSSRSKEIISHLIKKHEIHVLTYGKAYSYLKDYFPTTEIYGLHFAYKENSVDYIKTVKINISSFFHSLEKYKKLKLILQKFHPDIVISDFEPTAFYIAKKYRIPLISIDNQHRITNLSLDFPEKYKKDFIIAKIVIKSIIPEADYYFVTSFFKTKIIKRNTFLFDPIIRQEVRNLKPKTKDYILIYQTSTSNTLLLRELKKVNKKFIVYGFNVKKTERNLIFKKFSTKGFLNDLAGAEAVITNGGFTLITESIYLKKPVLSQPVKGQFEQALNAYYLQKLGYGGFCEKVTSKNIESFVDSLSEYRKNLQKIHWRNTKILVNKIDNAISMMVGE